MKLCCPLWWGSCPSGETKAGFTSEETLHERCKGQARWQGMSPQNIDCEAWISLTVLIFWTGSSSCTLVMIVLPGEACCCHHSGKQHVLDFTPVRRRLAASPRCKDRKRYFSEMLWVCFSWDAWPLGHGSVHLDCFHGSLVALLNQKDCNPKIP